MALTKTDIFYLLLAIALPGAAGVALSHPDRMVGLLMVAGIAGLVMVMMIVIQPSLGANILIIAIFTNISSLLTDSGYPGVIKPLVVVVFAAIMVRNYYAGQLPTERNQTLRVEFFIIGYAITVVLSYLVADSKSRAMDNITDLAKDIAILYTILFALRNIRDWKRTIWAIIITASLLSILGLFQVASGNYTETFFGLAKVVRDGATQRLGGPVNEPNMWGQIIVAVLSLAIFRTLHETHPTRKLISAGMTALIFMELLNTYSRGAYLAFSVAVFLIMFVFEKNFDLRKAILGVIVVVMVFPLLPASYRDRFSTLLSLSPSTENGIYEDSSFRGRTSEILTGLRMFAEHPILGLGAGNYRNNYQKYAQLIGIELRSEEREAHSLYIEVLAETGILGIFFFGGIIYSLFAALTKMTRLLQNYPGYDDWLPWLNAFKVALGGYLTAAIFLQGSYIRYFWIFVALTVTAIQLTDEMIARDHQSTIHEIAQ